MISRDYTKEVGIDSGTRTIPWPLAGVVLTLLAIGVWYAVGEARAAAQREQVQKEAVAAAPVATAAIKK